MGVPIIWRSLMLCEEAYFQALDLLGEGEIQVVSYKERDAGN